MDADDGMLDESDQDAFKKIFPYILLALAGLKVLFCLYRCLLARLLKRAAIWCCPGLRLKYRRLCRILLCRHDGDPDRESSSDCSSSQSSIYDEENQIADLAAM